MTDLALPALTADAAPEFVNAEGCQQWLKNVPLANVAAAQRELATQLSEFNRYGAPVPQRIAVLETVREAVHFVQVEQAKRFSNRALPMAAAEANVFNVTVELWEQMRLGYLRCVDAALAGEHVAVLQAALTCQRALAYSGLKMFHHFRAYREVPGQEWHALHQVYAGAETLGVAEKAVTDYLNRDVQNSSPRIAYVRALLLGLSNPNELSQRQLTFVTHLLERWGEKILVCREAPEPGGNPPLAVDLAGDENALRSGLSARDPRYLDVTRLAKSLRNRIGLLRRGESPARLALGEDCVQPACEQLLVFLYRNWCQNRVVRVVERHRTSDDVPACLGIMAIHYYVSGQAFRQPGDRKELTQKERDEIATFGRISTRHEDDYVRTHGLVLEQWQLRDESALGVRMVRRAGYPGKRYVLGQLVALRPPGAKTFVLGEVRWLMANASGELQAGLRLLPGLPAATAVRPTGLNVIDAEYVPALSLTAVPALDSPPTLILPSAWYKPKRVVEVFVEAPIRILLTGLVQRGGDFERVAYAILD